VCSLLVQSEWLTNNDKVRIANNIGKMALASMDDKTVSDACWMYYNLYKIEDQNLHD